MARSLAAKQKAIEGVEGSPSKDPSNQRGTLALSAIETAVDNAAHPAGSRPLPPPSPPTPNQRKTPRSHAAKGDERPSLAGGEGAALDASTANETCPASKPNPPGPLCCSPVSIPSSPSASYSRGGVAPPSPATWRSLATPTSRGEVDDRFGSVASPVVARGVAASASPRPTRRAGGWAGGTPAGRRPPPIRVPSLDLEAELGHMRAAAKIPVADILADVKEAKRGLAQTKGELKFVLTDKKTTVTSGLIHAKNPGREVPAVGPVSCATRSDAFNDSEIGADTSSVKNDAGVRKLAEFVEGAEGQVAAIELKISECVATCKRLGEFFGEGGENEGQSAHILTTLVQFLDLLSEAKKAEGVC